ncbi:S41 family peptidase [Lutispora thermophila]|uniref:Peptidase family S41 n=1 Tax=Lutispora thermophila DSM 19022 TaxID=1122184 RepID=A0A1M6EVI6_9FIRM|nr:S41 family peptidase [Lutispora thermophila]SHI89433.1 Peptidase family S41 [Lutispora thermophila DSM 19022]
MRDKAVIENRAIIARRKKSMLFAFVVLIFFIVYRFSLLSYFGFVIASDAKNIIKDFESNYFYSHVLMNREYINLKNNIISKPITSKEEINNLIRHSKMLSDDHITTFSYADLAQGKFKYSLYKKMKFEKKKFNDDTFYIRLTSFGENAEDKFYKALDISDKLNYLILDLRGNHICNYDEVIKIADDLLPGNSTIATIEFANSKHQYNSNDFSYRFKKIFVFLDKESGCGSEMLALTLKENLKDNVEIIGKDTMGMDIGQVIKTYYNKINLSIASFKWDVKGQNSKDLAKYLVKYKNTELNNLEDYINVVETLK